MADIEYPLHFIHRDGTVWTADTPAEAAGLGVARRHREAVRGFDEYRSVAWTRIVEAEWIARDSLGRTVEEADLPRPPRAAAGWRARANAAARQACERGLPIPGTGRKGRAGGRGPFRRTGPYVGERRDGGAFARDLAEEGLPIRLVVRLRKMGPVPYEEGEIRRAERGWKSQRRTQHRDR